MCNEHAQQAVYILCIAVKIDVRLKWKPPVAWRIGQGNYAPGTNIVRRSVVTVGNNATSCVVGADESPWMRPNHTPTTVLCMRWCTSGYDALLGELLGFTCLACAHVVVQQVSLVEFYTIKGCL